MFEPNKNLLIESIQNKYDLAIQFFQSEKYKESEDLILEIINLIPDNSDIYNFYGRLKQFQGNFNKSIELLLKSIEINPSNFMAHYNLGLAYCIKKDLKNVKKHFEKYQEFVPNSNTNKHTCNLYISKLHFDELDIKETREYYEKSNIPLFVELSKLLVPRIYKSTEEIQEYRKLYKDTLTNLLSKNIDHLIVKTPEMFCEYLQFIYCYVFPLSYQGQNNREILQLQCKLYRKLFPCLNYTSKYINNISIKNNKIKIGFISTNFFNQSVSRDRMGVIRNLPREIFDVVVFFYFKPSDDLGNFIWESDNTNIVLPDTNIFDRRKVIEEQQLNILIYCDIGMAPDTYFLSFSRLAPIQCNTWGHSDTSGIDTIDYYLSSVYYEKDYSGGHPENNYSEKLVLMDSLCTYYYKIIEDPTIVTKNYFGFSNNTNIYLSSQVLFKLNPNYDKVINNILENDPNGIVVFIKMNLGSYIQDILINRLEKTLKQNMTRFHLVEWQKCERDFYKLLSIADVIIDPYPFGGCNTSFSAFSMGIPIVTMPADFINGRFTYGLYKKMGIMDLVAYNDEDYVKLANKCATDKTWRNEISEKIKNNIHLIFNEPDSITTWVNFCINVINNKYNTNPIYVSNKNINDEVDINNDTNTNIDINNEDRYNIISNIPKIIHFIYFGYTEYKFIHYLAIKSAYDNNPNYKIYLYNYVQPKNNKWWELSKDYVEIIYTEPPEEIFSHKLNNFAHKADIIRLQKLIEYGGIYLDIDIWTINSYDTLLNTNKSCIMGYQASNTQFEGLCNAIICAKPQSEFLKIWYENYKTFDNTKWDNHSVYLPLELSKKVPDLIEIKPQSAFFPVSWWEFDTLFKKNKVDLSKSYCIHLWESHLMETLLKNINPIYFNVFDTPISHTFKYNIINKSLPKILYVIDNNSNNLDTNLNNTYDVIYNLLYNGYDVSITYYSDLLNNTSNSTFMNNTSDINICINNLYKKFNVNNIDNIDNIDIVITNLDKDILFNTDIISNSNIEKTSIIQENDLLSINSDRIPFIYNKNFIKYKTLYNSELYGKIDQLFDCVYSENIIKINNIFIENYKCDPLENVKKDKYIFYTIGQLDESIYSVIDAYYKLSEECDNILLYIASNYNDETINILNNISEKYRSYSLLFNFNNFSDFDINMHNIHDKCNCYIDNSNSKHKYNALWYKNPVILFEKNDLLKNMWIVNQINKICDSEHLYYLMNNIYINKDSSNVVDIEYNNLVESYSIENNKLHTFLKNKKVNMVIKNVKKKREILMIGKFTTFKNRMDTSYYKFLEYLKDTSMYKIVFVDSKSCEINRPLEYYINKYCETTDPIIYNIVYTHKSEQIISDLADSKLIKIYEIEDSYEVDNLIYNINTFKYDYVIYRYNCEQIQYIASKCNSKFVHLPHFINPTIFNMNNKNEKTIDILLYGNISNFYPFRHRLFNLIKKSGLNYYYLPHPGYNEYLNEDNPNKVVDNELSQLINKAKITISTCSSFNYLLKKYIEISLSGSIIAGNFPVTEENLYKDCMCLLDETDSDEVIIEKLKKILELSDTNYNNIIKNSYNISIENYIYNNGLERFNKIIDYMCKN